MNKVTFESIITKKMTVEQFKREYWKKKTLIIKNAVKNPEALCNRRMFEQEINKSESEWKFIPINTKYAGAASRMPVSTPIQAKKLRDMGFYMFVQDAEKGNRNIYDYLVSINQSLSTIEQKFYACFFQSELGGGHSMHSDLEDVFVIHLEGKRKWKIGKKPHEYGTMLIKHDDKNLAIASGPRQDELVPMSKFANDFLSVTVEPGDFIYMPAHTLHATESSPEYTLALSSFKAHYSTLDVIKECLTFNDYHFFEKMAFDIPVPDRADAIKDLLCKRTEELLAYLKKQDETFFASIGHLFKLHHPFYLFNETTSEKEAINIELNTTFAVNRSRCYKIVDFSKNGPKQRNLYIDGQLIEFDQEKWYRFADMICDCDQLTGQDVLKACGLKPKEGWQELKQNFTTLVEMGVLEPQGNVVKMTGKLDKAG